MIYLEYFIHDDHLFSTSGNPLWMQQLESDVITRQDTTHTFHGSWLQVAVSFASHIWVITLSHAGRVTGQPILLVTWLEMLGSLCWVVAGMWRPHALIGGSMSFTVGTCWQVRKTDFLHGTPQRFPKVTGFRRVASASNGQRVWIAVACEPQLQLPHLHPFAIFKLIVKDGLSMLSRNS